jgi:tetratricopeptide (TPR) repeat protein
MLALAFVWGGLALAQHAHDDHTTVPADAPPPLFEGLGDHHFPITTSSEETQQYFDQGLIFTYGFNHFEAVRSFSEAVNLDPMCAMCYWGVALALGPHINAPMFPEAVAPAYEALQRALELAPAASEVEQAYIEALATRYEAEAVQDRSHLDRAYADAMRDLVVTYPDDLDAAALFAESLMNLVPWNYWDEYGEPRPETEELVEVLESVLAREPYHPGATHYYIHAIENSPYPERAEGAADRLSELNIRVGHMIHMPSHIYARIGRWHDASVANEGALADDEGYLAAHEVEGLVPLLYHPHNFHFLSWTAGMEGRSALAYQAATELVAATPQALAADLPFLNNFLTMPTLTLVRFEQWDDILAEPQPAAGSLYQTAIWHYARGLAFAATGQVDEAQQEAASLDEIASSQEAQALETPEAFFPGASIMTIANTILQAEVALMRGQSDEAVSLLEEAVAMQAALPYFEPPYWFASARLNLGKALLSLDRPEEAEAVYREDLGEYPHNGWALHGLVASLRAQDKLGEAEEVERRFEEAWQHADVTLTTKR